ncbi:MAG: winged helix DNA-binding domain-containing protein [Jatrophihabitans sp.]
MPAPSRQLSARALNRALLARQGLLQPWQCSAVTAVERLIGLQAQSPTAPYIGLWSRLVDFEPDGLARLMQRREVVRIALMRSTLQLVSARDCLQLRPILAADLARALPAPLREHPERAAIAERARAALQRQPRTFAELGTLLAAATPQLSPQLSPQDLCRIARNSLPLVQITPRGVWGQSMAATHTTAEAWLGRPLATGSDPAGLIRRYLTAFGPATVADLAAWSGMAGLRAHVERLRPELRSFSNERGQELLDIADGPLPDPDTPAPVRILAEYDNLLLGHADRSRIFDDAHRSRFMSVNGIVRSTFLIDGFVAGTCALSHAGRQSTATLQPFGSLRPRDATALRELAARLLAFAAPPANRRQVVLAAD